MKQMKILGVIAMALALGLTACGGKSGGNGGSQGGSSTHKHEAAENAPWQSNDSKHWKDCKDNDGGKVDEKSHTWVSDEAKAAQDTESTCTVKGIAHEKCSVCGKERTREKALADHVYAKDEAGEDLVTWTSRADCENDGAGTKQCQNCDHVEEVTETKLGHLYAKDEAGEDLVTWTKEANCTEAGVGTKTCTRDGCGHVENVTKAALGHDLQLVDGSVQPQAGKATVRLYKCSRCEATYMGFLANEVTDESKDHLTFAEPNSKGEIGASFWGRPIGNSLALDATGTSINQQADECVYCSTETGDFFEYVFDLTEEQAAELAVCRLYLDAKPADHMNGGDFFAYREGNSTDWTPGYYIDGSDDHIEKGDDGQPVMVKDHARVPKTAQGETGVAGEELTTEVPMGKRITDFRYILYVDGQVKSFDSETKNPTHGNSTNMQREEFELPFTFNLHKGENRISLRMAGGYRSTFYKFTFRPYEEPAPEDKPVEPAAPSFPAECPALIDTSAWTAGTPAQNKANKTYTPLSGDGKVGVKIAWADVSSGAYDGSKLPNSAGNGVTYQVKAPKAGLYEMIMKAKVSSSSGTSETFTSRGLKVTINTWASQANIYGARVYGDAGLSTSERKQFVVAVVALTGEEDSIYIEQPFYRFDFESGSDVIFAEI